MKKKKLSLKELQAQCLIVPLGEFGNWRLGYSGCHWCTIKKECKEFFPYDRVRSKRRSLKRIEILEMGYIAKEEKK